ncbi:hypothetical protein B7463_g93, partial [Scytalidium lignicola]
MSTTTMEPKSSGDIEANSSSGIMSEKDPGIGGLPENPSISSAPVDVVPDGGLEAWMVVFGAWCTSFCSFGWINSIGVFQDYYEKNTLKQYSPSTTSWIVSLESFFLMAMTPIIGKLYDNYGTRWLVLGGSFLHVFGLMMASISTQYYQLLLSQGICSSIGASALFLPSFNCVSGYFSHRRATAFGILATGSSTGANLTIRSRIPSQPKSFTLTEFIRPFKELAFTGAAFGNFLFGFGVYIPITYIIVQATSDGMGQDLAQYLIPILNAASLFDRLSCGIVADRIGRFNMYTIACYTTALLILALWILAKGNAALIIFPILFGFASGAYASLGPAVVAQVSPIQDIGIRTGLFFAVSSVSALTSGPIAGAILDSSNGSFLGVKIFAGVLCIGGASLMLGGRFSKTGFKLMAKF